MGNRIRKQTNDPNAAAKIFIVDIAGELPTILCEIDPNDCSLKNSYFYGSNAQVLCQLAHGVDPNTLETTVDKYFYLHDRLGSVRQMIDDTAAVVNSYTYDPYGNLFTAELSESVYNPFKFTGQWYDTEIDQYYLRARQYDPQLMRFTTRDPVRGKFKQPLTVHRYLYCINDPVNSIDPTGRFPSIAGQLMTRAIKSSLAGALSGGMSGVNSKLRGGEFWQGFGVGFAAGATPAFFSASGYFAAGMSGAISAGLDSAIDGNQAERVVVDALVGAGIGIALKGYIDSKVDVEIGMNLTGEHSLFLKSLISTFYGSMGGDIWTSSKTVWE